MNKKTNVKIGLFVIAALLVLSVFVTFLVTKNMYEENCVCEDVIIISDYFFEDGFYYFDIDDVVETGFGYECVNGEFSFLDYERQMCVPYKKLNELYCGGN